MTKQIGSKKRSNTREPIAPDGGYGWVILFACFVISFIIDGCMYSIGIILPKIKLYFDISQDKANLLTSLNTGFLFFSGPIVSGLSNQFGIRPVVMGGAVVTAFVYVLSAYSPSIYIIMVAYGVIGGISTGCTYIASLIIIAQYFDKLKGITTGITMSGSGFGAFAFAPIAQFLVGKFDWQETLVFIGAIIIQCCVMGALLRPVPTRVKALELKEARSIRNEKDRQDDNFVVQSFSGSMASIRHLPDDDENSDVDKSCCKSCLNISYNIIKEITDVKLITQNLPFFLITLSNFFVFFGYFLPYIYIPIRAKEINLESFSWILSIIGIFNIPSRLLFGVLADKRYLSPINLNTLSAAIGAISLWLFPFFNKFWNQAIFAALFATGIGGMNCLCTPYLTDIVGKAKFGNAMGIISLFRGFGCFMGPFVGGFISEKYGSSLAAFYCSAVCFTLGFAFSLLVSIGDKCSFFKKKDDLERSYNSV